ncbi:MAG: glutathione S-transferase N-terminal domain-containing protein [Alphaproteobacteria bacterium]|nr:glutathione S-transferase N-terminal domain-containing protein [Alphaproteobacteria bacterium]
MAIGSAMGYLMTIQLFDLACANQRIFFSPYCWRIRMSLKHKGIPFESLPWHFSEKDRIEASGSTRVPVILDQGRAIAESWDIADYLDKAYPEAPPLMAGTAARARAKFIESWCNATVFPTMRAIAVPSVFEIIADKDKAYFRESREKMLGSKLEELSKDPAAETAAMNKALKPAADALTEADFLAGTSPDYADYVLFGTIMWPYVVCRENPLDMSSPIGEWFERMLNLHDGFARGAARAHG